MLTTTPIPTVPMFLAAPPPPGGAGSHLPPPPRASWSHLPSPPSPGWSRPRKSRAGAVIAGGLCAVGLGILAIPVGFLLLLLAYGGCGCA